MALLFTGVISSMVTPFDQSDRLDETRLRRLIDRQLAAGVHGFLIAGNCGEFTNLTDQERIKAVEVSVKHIAGRAPVMAGDFHPNTAQAVALARAYKEVGAAAALLTPPYFMRPSQDGVVGYFADVAAQSDLPVIVYNNPGRTGLDLTPAIMRHLYDLPGVVGLKDCTRDLATMAEKVEDAPKDFCILYGDDDMFFESLMMGAVGGVLAAANLVPETLVEIYRETVSGDTRRASDLQNRLLPMIRSWYTANHPAPIKEAMAVIGRPAGAARKPLMPPSPEQSAEIRRTLAALGLLK
ncbi:MAG: 4-hydroxy-tetrahydrodipicolinate synthase [Chloroflexota bacterium]|jgi:4-hydroxy-tetrahydrodipicolinate synthase